MRGILFEPADAKDPAYRATACTQGIDLPGEAASFRRDSLLVKWLRVNGTYLPVPDSHGLCDELPEADRYQLKSLRIAGCLPLVYDRDLIAWLAIVEAGSTASENLANRMAPETPRWAARLHDAREAWRERMRTEAVARSQRLSVAGQMAASIAHEIRNPLAAIRSAVQNIRDDDAPRGEHQRLLTAALGEVDRVNDTLTDLLALGRPHPSQHETCDLQAVSNQAATFCRSYADQRGVTIECLGVPAIVDGDPFELRQVLVNLILNACQASKHGDRIRIETSMENAGAETSQATVRVTDSGTGIPEHEAPRVFDAFYTTKADGGGLGLAICREIIGRHHGQIGLTSDVGKGTVVVIHFPR